MFGAVVVHLQRELRAGLHGDVLDLVAGPRIHRVIGAPRTAHRTMALGFHPSLGVHAADQFLDLLHLVLVGDHHRVLGVHHHQVVDTEQGDQLGAAVDEAVVTALHQHIALEHVAVAVLVVHVPQRRPAADVAPAGIQRHHAGALGLLHHRVVDGVVRATGEGGGVDANHVAAHLAALQGQHAIVVDVRLVRAQLVEVTTGAEQEHAAVPEVAAVGDEGLRSLLVRLLDELHDPQRPRHQQVLLAGANAADVAEAGFRALGGNAEQHHLALLGRRAGDLQGLAQGHAVADHMVGGQHQQQVVAPLGEHLQRRQGHRRRGVAPERLEQQRLGGDADGRQLLVDDEAVLLVAHHDGLLHALERQALQGLLEQRLLADQGEELLGIELARQRPQA
ncbi:hypothetical protein D9M70_436800 [compost metagenome]